MGALDNAARTPSQWGTSPLGRKQDDHPQLSALPAARVRQPRQEWERRNIANLRATDSIIVVVAVATAHAVRFGHDALVSGSIPEINYSAISILLAGAWIGSLAAFRTRSRRVVGSGVEEYQRIVSATVRLFGIIAIVSLIFRIELARGYLAIAFPLGLSALLASRWLWRKRVSKKRTQGEYQAHVLVVGAERAALNLAQALERNRSDGHRVVGVCVPGTSNRVGDQVSITGRRIPILGDETEVIQAIKASGADTVAVTATEHLGQEGIRRLVWDLEPHHVDLVVAPGVVDVSGPRLAMRPVADLPLIHVEKPQYHGANRFTKALFDRVGAAILIAALAPLLIAVAITIKMHDQGPIFFRQKRVGQNGRTIKMWKFRSMVPDADKRIDEVRKALGQDEVAFFKSNQDPRITPIGRIIRRTSIDELPQLFNVLAGEMSLVGPRPLVDGEGSQIHGFLERRMLVKPGMTGLWQVSGRSELSESERVRLDLYYIENWSMIQDLLIMWKTVRAVIRSEGAY